LQRHIRAKGGFQTNKKKRERVAAAHGRPDRLGDPGKGVVESKGSWYDLPRVAVIISIAAFALTVIPTWYPIVVSWWSPNFVGTIVTLNNQSGEPLSTWDGSARVCIVPFHIILLTNNTSRRLGISGFKMERKLTSGKWDTLRPATLSDPPLVEMFLHSTSAVGPVFLFFGGSGNYFDRLAGSKMLEPGDSIFGWTFIKANPAQFLPLKSRWWPPTALWSSLIGANGVRLVIYDTLGGVTRLDVSTVPAEDPRVSLVESPMAVYPWQFWANEKLRCED
jgi:hypothetical protein